MHVLFAEPFLLCVCVCVCVCVCQVKAMEACGSPSGATSFPVYIKDCGVLGETHTHTFTRWHASTPRLGLPTVLC